ncbi:nucleoside-diphosphate-sugar epimerase [Streptomyces sp. TLI_55]|uniref:NAD-dependent epimerase/dehydratase family protein n=1 Tax=Streptomyces sp. TLI_55 TaxID=1938861 RepID=UPI000BD779D8|nr:NAD(P)-dependent oxidoreductase [Streptomyces sp. TLI_55]SNX88260.1 nucleoside-diphosphate-sugar epimerase [Streptomyces sp. TLI_55]
MLSLTSRPSTATAAGSNTGPVLVVGGTGFIGSAVLRELTREHSSPTTTPAIRVLSRTLPHVTAANAVRHVAGDITDPSTLHGVCAGVETVIHAASYVGRDLQKCHDINYLGTQALLEEARRSGVRRFLYVSTASVYGMGPHRGPAEGQLTPSPASPASISRLRAEEAVRAAGGIVLRPHLIYGAGDRWFIPTLARVLRQAPYWPAGATPRASVIAAEDLARVIVTLTRQSWHDGETYHVADPRPLPMDELYAKMRAFLGLPMAQEVPPKEHRALVRQLVPDLSDHQYALLTEDCWFDTSRIWQRTGLHPGPGFEQRLAACSAWYAKQGAPEALTPPATGRQLLGFPGTVTTAA